MMRGDSFDSLYNTSPPVVDTAHFPMWIEAIWEDEDGTVYAWYHHEPGICGGKLTAPAIGALVSDDGGFTFRDLGIVLSSGYEPNCSNPNGFFAGGHGDFSVIPDREHGYFYFLFTNYGGPAESHGVAVARMEFDRRADPVGAVFKLRDGSWSEPGVGGEVTPVLRATVGWDQPNTDSFWGPAVHWNTFLEKYVILLNRSCCEPGWPQEGIYILFAPDLADPGSWTKPEQLLDNSDFPIYPGYYPQAVGMEHGESDTLAGEFPRLYVQGISAWVLVFSPDGNWEGTTGCTAEDLLRRGNGKADPAGVLPLCGPATRGSATGR